MRVAHTLWFPALLSLTTLLTACSEGATDDTAATTRRAAKRAAIAAKPVAPKHDLVSAVSVGKPGAPVDLHFELGARPVVGQPLTVTIELTPRSTLGQLQATVLGNDGVAVAAGELEAADRPAADVAVTRTLSVTPLREGVFYLAVTVYASDATASSSRSFAIPIVVGDAGSAAAAQKPETSIDATHERVEKMAAQESSSSH
jgi:hypothetical protein